MLDKTITITVTNQQHRILKFLKKRYGFTMRWMIQSTIDAKTKELNISKEDLMNFDKEENIET